MTGSPGGPVPGDQAGALLALMAGLEPALSTEAVLGALGQAAARPDGQRRIAAAVVAQPDLLTGQGARAPLPSVLRFISALARAGAAAVVEPPCPRCGRQRPLDVAVDGLRVCGGCRSKARELRCGRCGKVPPPAARSAAGRCPTVTAAAADARPGTAPAAARPRHTAPASRPAAPQHRTGRRSRSRRHARAVEIRQQASDLIGTLADTASGQQALFASPGARRGTRPTETARILHRLITELATLATAATVTKRTTKRRPPAGTPQTSPLFDNGDLNDA